MVDVGKLMGRRMIALITDMNQPLGSAVGNALEVAECIAVLKVSVGGGQPMSCTDIRIRRASSRSPI